MYRWLLFKVNSLHFARFQVYKASIKLHMMKSVRRYLLHIR